MHVQDNPPASPTAGTHPCAPDFEIDHTEALQLPSLAHLDMCAAPAEERSASTQGDCQTHFLAQLAQTSAADTGSLRRPVLEQHRSVPSNPPLSVPVSIVSLSLGPSLPCSGLAQ